MELKGARMAINRFGCEIDSAFTDANGAAAVESAGFSFYRHVCVDWDKWQPLPTAPQVPQTEWQTVIDAGLRRASIAGMKIIIVVRQAPAWATISGITGCGDLNEAGLAAFPAFMDYVVDYYEQSPFNVRRWELWNEPDDQSKPPDHPYCGCRSVANYVAQLKATYSYVKTRHPSATIITGGVVNTGSWLGAMLAQAKGNYDAVAYHSYETIAAGAKMWRGASDTRPAEYLKRIDAVKNYLAAAKAWGTPIYMTEGGVVTVGSVPWADQQRIQSYFAAYMTAQVSDYGDLALWSWFRTLQGFTSSLGECQPGGVFATNDVYKALKFGIQQTAETTYVKTTRSDISMVQLHRNAGGYLFLLWNTGGRSTYNLGYTPKKVWDVWGQPVQPTRVISVADPYRVVWYQL